MNRSRVFTLNSYFSRLSHGNQYRLLSASQTFMKNPGFNKKKTNTDSTMENAPKWDEAKATESEADIKADKGPEVSPEDLEEETAKFVRSHKDDIHKTK